MSSDSDGIKVSTIYSTFSGGNRVVTSTPYRSTSDATLEWSCTQADASGRVTDVGMFTGSSAPSACTSSTSRTGLTHTDYNVEVTTVTDPASKRRDETRDALGRLTSVVEDQSGLNYTTSYAYDPLDNLTGVTQGSQSRTFNYSSLGLLKNATNPESGTIGYTYTAGGDLDTRTDARSVSTTYSYDGLHRVLTKNYSDSTPDVTYAYATSGTCKIGQLASVTTSASTTTYDSYDCLGHVTGSTQTIAANSSNPYSFGYTWGLADNLKTMTYPSGKLVNYDFDDAGRISKVYTSTKTYGDLTTGSGVAYTPSGQLAKIKLGNDLWETRDFHTPGTATKYRLGTTEGAYDRLELEYNFSGTVNNGNVASHVIRNGGSTWTQSFTYDGVNRLSTAAETSGYSQAYGYDQWGNRWVSSGNRGDVHEPTVSTNFSSSTNRLSIQSSTYDSAGNQTFYTPYTLAYDAENRNTSVTSSSNGNASFVYDGDGHRVIKTWTPNGGSATTSYYVYDALGELAAEYSTQSATTGTSWNFTDMLGSVRAVTGEKPTSGNASITECYDYLPFGQMLGTADNGRSGAGCYPNLSNPISTKLPQKFTGKERDQEAGLDFFGARYMSAAQGRFTSADPYVFQFATGQHANDATEQDQLRDRYISNPQVWNKYSYGLNNPLKFIDPSGKCSQPTNQKEGETGICVEAFIAQNWFKLVGRGDNRGFSGTDKNLTARSRVKFTVDKDGKVTAPEVESARSGVVVKGMGLKGDTVAQVNAKANGDGSVSVHVSLWGRNGEAFLAPLAPSGVLQGNFNLNVSKSGQVSFVPEGSSATTFPSWGVYGYGANGSVQTVKEIPERKIEDLQKPPVPIR